MAETSAGAEKLPAPARTAALTTGSPPEVLPGQATIASPAAFITRSLSTGPIDSGAGVTFAGGEKLPPAGLFETCTSDSSPSARVQTTVADPPGVIAISGPTALSPAPESSATAPNAPPSGRSEATATESVSSDSSQTAIASPAALVATSGSKESSPAPEISSGVEKLPAAGRSAASITSSVPLS